MIGNLPSRPRCPKVVLKNEAISSDVVGCALLGRREDLLEDKILQQYDDRFSTYSRFGRTIQILSKEIVHSLDIGVVSIDSRIKSRESLSNKLARPDKSGKYSDIIDVTDICGVRIVAFTQSDAAAISREIRSHFIVDEVNSVDKSEGQDPDRFGYASTHIIVSLSGERSGLLENRGMETLKAEIQVRTVLQHAWASLDWKLRYKSEVEVPAQLRRKLYRVSALLEAADDIFSDLESGAENLRKTYATQISEKVVGIPINKDSLSEYMKESESVSRVFDLIESAGIPLVRNIHRNSSSAWSYLINSLASVGIVDLDALGAALDKVGDRHIKLLTKVWEAWGRRTFGAWSPLRILVLTTIPKNARAPAFDEAITSSPLADAERSVLLK